MRSVSNAFKKVIKDGGPFYAYAQINLQSGGTLNLNSQDDFFVSGNKYDQSCSAAFPMGDAVCKTIDIGINNTDDTYSVHDFDGAQIVLYTEIDTDNNSVERLQEGVFNVLEAKAVGDIIEISGVDNMHKADCDMPTVTYPATLRQIVSAICAKCGLVLGTVNFNNWNYRVTVAPKEMTCREMLGYVAQIAGGNAMIDYTGQLIFKEYTRGQYSTSHIVSGGTFGDGLTDEISGGTFGDGLTNTIEPPQFDSQLDYIVLSDFTTDPTIATDDVIITGVSYTWKQNNVTRTELYGTDGYVLKIDNPLIRGHINTGIRLIGNYIIGMKVRPFSGTFKPNPTIELMDTVYVVDKKENVYQSFVTSNTFTYLGGSEVANEIKSPEENKASYTSSASQIYRQVQEDIDEDRADWGTAVDQLTTDLANASGLFETTEQQPDQSYIYYFHDKATLAESQIVIKITAQALAISTDGGQTFPTGITATGQAIVAQIATVGLSADYITTGTLKVGGTNNVDGDIKVYDNSNDFCGSLDNLGLTLSDGSRLVVDTNNGVDAIEIGSDRIIIKNSTNQKNIINSTDKLIIQFGQSTKFQIDTNQTEIADKLNVTGGINVRNGIDMNDSGYLKNVNIYPGWKYYGRPLYTGSVTIGNKQFQIVEGLIEKVNTV